LLYANAAIAVSGGEACLLSSIGHLGKIFRLKLNILQGISALGWLLLRPAIDCGEGLIGEAPANTDSFSRKLFWAINETLGEEMKNSLWDQRPLEIFKNSELLAIPREEIQTRRNNYKHENPKRKR
jgi:hypothetical protein